MAAMAAGRSIYFKDFKKRLTEAGKSKMTIIGAIMRKLMVVIRAVVLSNQPFDRFRFCKN
jgi:phosphohistidine phosphatase SixA